MIYQFNHFGLSEHFCKEYGKNFNFPLHLHHSFEVITVTEGQMEISIDNHTYVLKKGESVLVFPNQLHSLSSKTSEHMLCIFSPELVRAYASKVLSKRPTDNMIVLDSSLTDALSALSPASSIIEKKGVLYSVCASFDKSAEYVNRSEIAENLIYEIFEFVESNYGGDCSLDTLTVKTGYSYSYLSRCFKKVTGIAFNTYVNQYRISNACYLLSNSNHSILRCALDSGYKSLRSFNRNFAAFLSLTPKEYRERCKRD